MTTLALEVSNTDFGFLEKCPIFRFNEYGLELVSQAAVTVSNGACDLLLYPAHLTISDATLSVSAGACDLTLGPLPSGLSFEDNGDGTGRFYGTPAAGTNGVYPVTLTVTDTNGEASKSYILRINSK